MADIRLIDANALLEDIEEVRNVMFNSAREREEHNEMIDFALNEVMAAPTIEAEPVRHGHWITVDSQFRVKKKCSICGNCDNPFTAIAGHYCWFCGAKMDLYEETTDGTINDCTDY